LLTEVSSLIKIKNFDKVQDVNSIIHYYYQGDHCFKLGTYDTKKILLLGFLFCHHKDDQHQAEALWGLVNNEMHNTINRKVIQDLYEDLAAFAIDCPLKYLLS
jgi:hypothetical protein